MHLDVQDLHIFLFIKSVKTFCYSLSHNDYIFEGLLNTPLKCKSKDKTYVDKLIFAPIVGHIPTFCNVILCLEENQHNKNPNSTASITIKYLTKQKKEDKVYHFKVSIATIENLKLPIKLATEQKPSEFSNTKCNCLSSILKRQQSYHYLKSVQIRSFFWSVFSHIRTQ